MRCAAACHVHSNWSYDGKWPLEDLAAEFQERGYRVLLMTEHDRGFTPARLAEYRDACAAASTERILLVPGIEYSDRHNIVHILTWGAEFLGEGRPTPSLLAAAGAANAVTVLAHPTRRNAWNRYAPDWSEHLLGIELWNRKTDGWAPSPDAQALIDSSDLVPFAGMDFHDSRQMFPLVVELQCDGALSEDSVLGALRSRRCRATVFGRPIEQATRGWFGGALRSCECCRRTAATAFRFWRRARAA